MPGNLRWEAGGEYRPSYRRDLLVHSMCQVAQAEYRIVMHVHVEIITETPNSTVDEVCDLMSHTPPWAEGLPLDADGFKCSFYRKD